MAMVEKRIGRGGKAGEGQVGKNLSNFTFWVAFGRQDSCLGHLARLKTMQARTHLHAENRMAFDL